MAIALGTTDYHGISSGTTNTSVASNSLTTTGDGNSLYVCLVSNQSGTDSVPTVSDNYSNVWTQASSVSLFSQQNTTLFYTIAAAGGSGLVVTASWSANASLAAIIFAEFTGFGAGAVGSHPAGTFNGSGNSPTTAPSITTTVANQLVVNAFSMYSGGAYTITDSGAPWAIAVKHQTNDSQDGALAYQVVSSPGAVADVFTYNAFGYSAALAVSFTQSSGDSLMGQAWM